MYISVTGLKPKGLGISFWMHAIPCNMQCQKSQGLIHMQVEKVSGWNHTFTAWESREAMESFMHSGAHAKAMAHFHNAASEGKTLGYESETLPTFKEALERWREEAEKY
jgi:hypothetical protein